MTDTITATRRRRGLLLAGTAATAIIALTLSAYGLRTWLTARGLSSNPAQWAWTPLAALLLTQTTLYLCERLHRADARGQEHLDSLHVAVLMPVFNEDNGCLRAALSSLLAQTARLTRSTSSTTAPNSPTTPCAAGGAEAPAATA